MASGLLLVVALIAGGAAFYRQLVKRRLSEERAALLVPLEARLVSLCQATGQWPTREAGPVVPTDAHWADAPGFAALGDDLSVPLPEHYGVQISPGFRGSALRIELVGLPDTAAEDTWHTRRCVRDSAGCHCRTPRVASAATLRSRVAPPQRP